MVGYWLMPVVCFHHSKSTERQDNWSALVVTQAPVMNKEYCLHLNLLH